MFWLSHTYTYDSDELYPCRYGCSSVNRYKCTDVYDPKSEGGIPWNDPDIAIDWPVLDCEYKTSEKDEKHPSFKDQSFDWAAKW